MQSPMALLGEQNTNAGPAPAATAPATPVGRPPHHAAALRPARVTPAYAAADAERVTKVPGRAVVPPARPRVAAITSIYLYSRNSARSVPLPEQRMSELWQIRTPKPPQKAHKKRRITDVKPPPAVGTKIRVHTFPENDESKPAEWFPASGMSVPPAAQEETDRWKCGNYI